MEHFEKHPYVKQVALKMSELCGIEGVRESYLEEEWTEYEENAFKSWLVMFLLSSRPARLEIMGTGLKGRKNIEKAVDWFVAIYGPKIKDLKL